MSNNKILYIEDSDIMIDGLRDYFTTTEFEVKFVKDIPNFKKVIVSFSPRVIIADNDIGGRQYDIDVVQTTVEMRRKGLKIKLIGCTALGSTANMRRDQMRVGFDEFFDNDGSAEHLDAILEYIRKIID